VTQPSSGKLPSPTEAERNAIPETAGEHKKMLSSADGDLHTLMKRLIINEAGDQVFSFLDTFINHDYQNTLVVSTATRFNIEKQQSNVFNTIINLRKINSIRRINKFFEAVNDKLPINGLFIGCVQTNVLRKMRILKKNPPVVNYIIYTIDFLYRRVMPKLKLTKRIYFTVSRGQNRLLSKAETYGRLYSCGFEIVEERRIGELHYFVFKKVKAPAYDYHPTYGLFIRLHRIGKNGKIIKVYKLRTMHPYSEYLQNYVYTKNHLADGGKFANDFRINTLGRFMRKFWIDELPMLWNVLKLDLKLFGVRPLSRQYFNMYDEDLRERRIKYKPGLIPPYYVDLPKSLEEIQASEKKYLDLYDKKPLCTDFRYFWKAFNNIVFRKARSR
jgi:lipopolysaccharide/colanic/teichoic acid biosynthesis glycosyltransferase